MLKNKQIAKNRSGLAGGNGGAAVGQNPSFSQLMGFNISAFKIKMGPKSAK